MALSFLGFCVSVVVILLVVIASLFGLTDPSFTGSVLLGSISTALVTLVILMMKGSHKLKGRLEGFAQALGGTVTHKTFGRTILCLPHPRGRVEIDYHEIGTGKYSSRVAYTRVALMCAAGEVPAERHMLANEEGARSLEPAAREQVVALLEAFGKPTHVRLVGKGRAPSVEVWLPWRLADVEAVRSTVETALPYLEALTSGPWSSQRAQPDA